MNGISIRLIYALSSIIILSLTLVVCGNGDPSPDDLGDVSDIWVEKPEASITPVGTEEFPFPNCEGTKDLSQSVGHLTSVKKGVRIGTTATKSGGGEVAIPEVVKVNLEAQVEDEYQQDYEAASAREDSIDMGAEPGSHIVYVIQWEEHKFASTVSYAIRGEVYTAPYTYVLRVPKVISVNRLPCPSPTSIATTISGPPIPTNTPSIPPTLVPTTESAISAEQAIKDYYEFIAQGQYDVAWTMVDEYNTRSGLSYDDYVSGWGDSGPAMIIEPIDVVGRGNEVTAIVTLYYPEKKAQHQLSFEIERDVQRGDAQFGYWLFVKGRLIY